METDWKQTDKERKRSFDRMDEAKKTSSAAKDFFDAAQMARNSAIMNGILPIRNKHGEFQYTVQQGLKAACHAREDVAATVHIQFAVLQRLDRNRNLLWVVIVLLVYVAYRLS